MTDGHFDLANHYADRVLALVGHCPVGQSLKARDNNRIAECTRTRDGAELSLKIALRCDVLGHALLHARFRLRLPRKGEASITLHHQAGRRETEDLTARQEKYLSALMLWAEQVLPAAEPVAKAARIPAWQKQFAELHHLLSGLSVAAARRRLRDGFFVDQEDSPETARMGAFLEVLRDEGWVALVDWNEETVDDMILDLAACRMRPSGPIDRAAVAAAGYDVVKMDDGSDGLIFAIVARDEVPAVGRLVANLAPDITIIR
ncbi:hypothetical protein ACG3SL_08205 [Sphingomonas sp. CJ20]